MSVKTDLYLDPQNECLVLRCVDETGAPIPTLPQIRLKLSDLQFATQIDGSHAIEAIFRRVHYTDSRYATKKRCYGLFTIPEADDTPDGHSDAVENLYM
jgi:hypothetical protein